LLSAADTPFVSGVEDRRHTAMKAMEVADVKANLESRRPSDSVVFFLGSYISCASPSSVPGVGAVREGVLDLLCRAAEPGQDVPNAVPSILHRLKDGDRFWVMPFELLMGVLHAADETFPTRIIEAMCLGGNKTPNYNHEGVAEIAHGLAGQGVNMHILTTNFDSYLEEALRRPFGDPEVKWQGAFVKECKFRCDDRACVICAKLHGSVDRHESLVNTFKAVSETRQDRSVQEACRPLATASLVLFCGYSASDLDIRPHVKAALQTNTGTVVWADKSEAFYEQNRQSSPAKEEFFTAFAHSFLAHNLMCPSNGLTCYSDKPGRDAEDDAAKLPPGLLDELLPKVREKLPEILCRLCEALQMPDALDITDSVAPAMLGHELRFQAYAFMSRYKDGVATGREWLRDLKQDRKREREGLRRQEAQLRAHLKTASVRSRWEATHVSTYRAVLAQLTRDPVYAARHSLPALAHFVLAATTTKTWRDVYRRDYTKPEAELLLECSRYWLHSFVRFTGGCHCLLYRLHPRIGRSVRAVLTPLLLLLSRRLDIGVAERLGECGLLKEEASARRDAIQALAYLGRVPEEEYSTVEELFTQLEQQDGAANIEMTRGRAELAAGDPDSARCSFLAAYRHARTIGERSLIAKSIGNICRIVIWRASREDPRFPLQVRQDYEAEIGSKLRGDNGRANELPTFEGEDSLEELTGRIGELLFLWARHLDEEAKKGWPNPLRILIAKSNVSRFPFLL